MTHTYEQIANDINLWNEFVNPNGEMTEAEFNALSTEEKIAIQVECFGEEVN